MSCSLMGVLTKFSPLLNLQSKLGGFLKGLKFGLSQHRLSHVCFWKNSWFDCVAITAQGVLSWLCFTVKTLCTSLLFIHLLVLDLYLYISIYSISELILGEGREDRGQVASLSQSLPCLISSLQEHDVFSVWRVFVGKEITPSPNHCIYDRNKHRKPSL